MNYNRNLPVFAKGQQNSTDFWNDFGYWNDGTYWFEATPTYTARVTAYANATGITDYTILDPLNIFDLGLTYYGLDTIMKAVYPMVTDKTSQSDMANQMKYNFMNPLDTNPAFRLNWVGGWVYSRTGALPNGSNAYAITYINANSNLVTLNNHISYYSRTSSTVGTQVEMGCFTSPSNFYHLRTAVNYCGGAINVVNFTSTSSALGFWMGATTASNNRKTYKNGFLENTLTANETSPLPAYNITIGGRNDNGIVSIFSNKECAFSSIGNGLTDFQADIFSTLVNNLQKALNRAVY